MSRISIIHNLLFEYFPVELCQIIIEYLCILEMGTNQPDMFNNIKYFLIETNSIIAGDYPLFSLYGIKCTKIKIYCDFNYFTRKSRAPHRDPRNIIQNIIINNYSTYIDFKSVTTWENNNAIYYKIKFSNLLLKFIIFKNIESSLIETTIKSIDLSFCKIIYDGIRVIIPNYKDLINMKGKIDNLNPYVRRRRDLRIGKQYIYNHCSELQPKSCSCSVSIEDNHDTYCDYEISKSQISKTIHRVNKYRKVGFNIKI